MPKVRRAIGAALMVAFVPSLAVQCVVGQEMTTAQMACCAATDHDCHEAGAVGDCCQSQRADQEQSITQIQPLVRPLALVSGTIPGLVSPLDTRPAFHVETIELNAAFAPKYVLFAAFLI